MEVVEDFEFKILRQILIENEFNLIPIEISKKLEVYFNENLDEYFTAKAVFETNRKNIGKLYIFLILFINIRTKKFLESIKTQNLLFLITF